MIGLIFFVAVAFSLVSVGYWVGYYYGWKRHAEVCEIEECGEAGCPVCDGECVWERDEDYDTWETSCGEVYQIMNGTPSDNRMEFCTYCGQELKEKATPAQEPPFDDFSTG